MTSPHDPYATTSEAGVPASPTWMDGERAGAYGEAPGVPRARRNGLGTAALVLGILAVVTCWTVVGGVILGLVAIVLGVLGRGRARRGEADNGGMALAGLVLGVVAVVLSGALLAFGVSVLNSPEGQQYKDCVRGANGDQTALQQCASEFNRSR